MAKRDPQNPAPKQARQLEETAGTRTRTKRSTRVEAARLWQGLIGGQWSMVRYFDRDGRRYVVARESGEVETKLAALSERERTVLAYRAYGLPLKAIAFEMRVSTATAGRALSSSLKKLGLHSQMQLPAVLATALRSRRG